MVNDRSSSVSAKAYQGPQVWRKALCQQFEADQQFAQVSCLVVLNHHSISVILNELCEALQANTFVIGVPGRPWHLIPV